MSEADSSGIRGTSIRTLTPAKEKLLNLEFYRGSVYYPRNNVLVADLLAKEPVSDLCNIH